MEKFIILCTQDDTAKLKEKLQETGIFDHSTRATANTKCRFYKLTNVTVFASLLKDKPLGCTEAVLHEPLLKNHNENCLIFERNTRQPYNDKFCLLRAIALHLHGIDRLEEETSISFYFLLFNSEEGDPSKFQGVHMNDISKIEDLLQLKIFLHDIDFPD